MDSMEVKIANITSYDIKEVKVHFTGCSGFDSFKTYPDTYGTTIKDNSSLDKDNVTIKYDFIPRLLSNSYSLAYINFYGLDASSCKPSITAQYKNGQSIRVKLVNDIDTFNSELAWEEYDRDHIFNIAYKIINGLALCFFYIQIRNLRKKTKSD